ncbi:MAG: hypothetical protein QME12_05700 [Nanoarchaeota archaeon]|nr:hypothetical protein [Nanoarchaeota archaeon]
MGIYNSWEKKIRKLLGKRQKDTGLTAQEQETAFEIKPWEQQIVKSPAHDGKEPMDLRKRPPIARDFNEAYCRFESLIEENFRALGSLTVMRTELEKGQPILTHCINAFNSIRNMAGHYMAMNPHANFNDITEQLRYVWNESTTPAVRPVDMAIRFGYRQMAEQKSKTLAKKVESLSRKLEYPKGTHFELAYCRTLHDLIRYFHQMGLDTIFAYNGPGLASINDYKVSYTIGDRGGIFNKNAKARIAKGGKVTKEDVNSKPLLAIMDFYDPQRIREKAGCEHYRAIGGADRVKVHCDLGCHSAEIDARIRQDGSFIHLRFYDTSSDLYPNAVYRTEYVKKVLERAGFIIRGDGRLTEAVMKGRSEADTYEALTKVAALIASTKDLDLRCSPLKGRVDDAVELFFGGKINIYKALGGN